MPRILGGVGYTAHYNNNSTGFNLHIQYSGGFSEDTDSFSDHLEGSFNTDYQFGIGLQGQNYLYLRPTLTYRFVEDEPLKDGPALGIYTIYGFGSNKNYYSLGLTGGYRVELSEKTSLDFVTEQGYGSQGFGGGPRNGVIHSAYRFSVGFRF